MLQKDGSHFLTILEIRENDKKVIRESLQVFFKDSKHILVSFVLNGTKQEIEELIIFNDQKLKNVGHKERPTPDSVITEMFLDKLLEKISLIHCFGDFEKDKTGFMLKPLKIFSV